jgi:hypothetical protein
MGAMAHDPSESHRPGYPAPPGRLTEPAARVWAAFFTGQEVDLTVEGDDDPADGQSWGPQRTVDAEVVADLLVRFADRAAYPRSGLRLVGMKITGTLDLSYTKVTAPVVFVRCWFTQAPTLAGASAVNLALLGCWLPGLQASLLELRGDLACSRSTITGQVQMADAHIGGSLDLAGAELSNPDGHALIGDRASVNGDLIARGGFTARGEVSLVGATVSGTVDLDGAKLHNQGEGRSALIADRLTVGGNLLARHGFTADGEVRLIHVRVGGQLNFVEATLTHSEGFALHVGAGRVNDLWLVFAVPPIGQVRLSGLRAEAIFDHPETWPKQLNLVGCTYNQLHARRFIAVDERMPTVPVDAHQRLAWLDRDPDGYAPQPYEQLAAFYRSTGRDSEARRVLLEKHRRRRDTLRWPGRLAGYLLDGLIGYGYRNWLAGIWLAAFWLLGTLAFTLHPPVPRSPAEGTAANPGLFALDLILPIINLGQEGTWRPTGAMQYVAAVLILTGWGLTTAFVAGLTRLVNRA